MNLERIVFAIVLTATAVSVGLMLSLCLGEPQLGSVGKDSPSSLSLLADGMRTLRRDGRFRGLVLLSLATIPFVNYLLNLYPPRFAQVGVPSIWLGLALALVSLLGVLGARYAYRLELVFGLWASLLVVTASPGALYCPAASNRANLLCLGRIHEPQKAAVHRTSQPVHFKSQSGQCAFVGQYGWRAL